MSLLQKTAESRLQAVAGWFFEEVEKLPSHDLGERESHKFADAFVDRAQRAIQGNRACGIFEGIDELLEAALGARNHLIELVQLLLRGSRAYPFLQTLQQRLEFDYF